jgi:hypothetical protein
MAILLLSMRTGQVFKSGKLLEGVNSTDFWKLYKDAIVQAMPLKMDNEAPSC